MRYARRALYFVGKVVRYLFHDVHANMGRAAREMHDYNDVVAIKKAIQRENPSIAPDQLDLQTLRRFCGLPEIAKPEFWGKPVQAQ